MDFKNSYRVEAVYFQKLKSDIDIAKSYIAAGATDEARAVLENLVDVDGAVLLLYRNIGECWAELANAIEKTKKELDALRDQQEQYHDELNEKIDEINNYIIRLINALDERLTAAEADIDDLQERMLAAESDIDDLQDRMTQAESDIDDLESNKQDKLTAGFGIEIDANNEISVDTDDVQEKLIAGQNITLTPDSTDPTKTVIDAAGESYTAGHGINIDSSDVISATDEALFLSSVGTLQSVALNTSDISTLMQTSSNDYEIGNDNKHFRDGGGGSGDSVTFTGKKRVRITATMLTEKEYTSAMASGLPFVDKQEADFEVSARISILQGSDTHWVENLTVNGKIVSHHNTSLNKDYVYFRAFEERTALIELDPTKTYKIHVYFYWYMKGDVFLHNTLIQGKFGVLGNLFGIEAYS